MTRDYFSLELVDADCGLRRYRAEHWDSRATRILATLQSRFACWGSAHASASTRTEKPPGDGAV